MAHAINSLTDDTPSMWESTSGTVASQRLQFDLGSPRNLGKIHLWNVNVAGNTGLGVKDLQVWLGDSSGNVIANLSAHPLAPGDRHDGLLRSGVRPQRRDGGADVKLLVLDNWAGTTTGQVGLSELRFEGVPERKRWHCWRRDWPSALPAWRKAKVGFII